jgi:hypothetical protein
VAGISTFALGAKERKMESSSRLAVTSLIISICGAIIALCALGLSFYMYWLQKNNYEISVQPYITLVPTIELEKNEYGVPA